MNKDCEVLEFKTSVTRFVITKILNVKAPKWYLSGVRDLLYRCFILKISVRLFKIVFKLNES